MLHRLVFNSIYKREKSAKYCMDRNKKFIGVTAKICTLYNMLYVNRI